MNHGFLGDFLPFFRRGIRPLPLTHSDGPRPADLYTLAEALLSSRGEASGVALASDILGVYGRFSAENRFAFLKLLAERFTADDKRVKRAIANYQSNPGAEAARTLHNAAEPRRQEFLRRLNLAPGGTAKLVRMREDVLQCLHDHSGLQLVDADFVHLFSSWFNRGFLVLKHIDWSTPAAILEKIIRYEAVHEIHGWADLQRRLDPADRWCFAFFHPALQDEPLIFVEVALTRGIPQAISSLLAEDRTPIDPHQATTAVFYSISNCQIGLKGISFGNFLIKQVVEELRRDLPHLRSFVTLSPVPGFAQWLKAERDAKTSSSITSKDRTALKLLDEVDWQRNSDTQKQLKPVLLNAIANYFLVAKTDSGKPIDPVARFHLGNGARLEKINWLGDVSPKGLREAVGFMVNYLYALNDIENNHEAFSNHGEVVTSRYVRSLLREKRRSTNQA